MKISWKKINHKENWLLALGKDNPDSVGTLREGKQLKYVVTTGKLEENRVRERPREMMHEITVWTKLLYQKWLSVSTRDAVDRQDNQFAWYRLLEKDAPWKPAELHRTPSLSDARTKYRSGKRRLTTFSLLWVQFWESMETQKSSRKKKKKISGPYQHK